MSRKRSAILLVDDNLTSLEIGRNMLSAFYQAIPAPSAAKMFEILEVVVPELILLDIDMPDMNGYEAMKRIKSDPRIAEIPVIFLTSLTDASNEVDGFDLGAVDYVTKPFTAPVLLKRIERELLIVQQRRELLAGKNALRIYADSLEQIVSQKTAEVVELQNAVLSTVADMVEFRDRTTGGHIARTQLYLKALIERLIADRIYSDEIATWDMEYVLPSAQLHDVGKIAVSDAILNKPDQLTPCEFETMKTHVAAGVDAIEHIINNTSAHTFLEHALHIAGTHHEKWDGSGYPLGLKGSNIPLEGRLMAIADVYDALVTKRPYKEACSHEEACKIIEEGSGSHFDPVLVEQFIKIEDEFACISQDSDNENRHVYNASWVVGCEPVLLSNQ